MSLRRSFSALAVALGLVLAPDQAHAQNMESTAGAALGILAATPAVAFGLVTDIGIAVHLARHGQVPRWWAVSGTVSWAIASVAWTPVMGVALDAGNYPHARDAQMATIGFAGAGAGVILGSLALSIHGLTHPAPVRPVTFLPVVAPGANGSWRVGLGGAF